MIQTNTAAGLQWKWRQPQAFQRFHEMTSNNEVVCTLQFAGGCGSLARADSVNGSWTFKRSGLLTPRVTVRQAGEAADTAVFFPKWTGGGELQFADGARYMLKSLSFWGGDWAFENLRGETLLSLHGPHGFLKSHGEIEVNTTGGAAELTLLAALAWYLRLLMIEDAAVSSAVIS
ncbi:MAG: hypothetical protein ABI806_28410 [Candidatus Solibacter sp.]